MRAVTLLLLALAVASPARADDYRKTFRDWEAMSRFDGWGWVRASAPGKSDTGAQPGGGAPPGVELIRRSADDAAYALVIVSARALDASRPVTLTLDTESIALKPNMLLVRDAPEAAAVQDAEALGRIAGRLKTGQSLGVAATGRDGKPVSFKVSLSGLAAAMLFLDDKQGRVGKPVAFAPLDPTLDATKQEDIGYKTAVDLPKSAVWPEGWRGIPRALIEKNIARGGCDASNANFAGNTSVTPWRLDPVVTLYEMGCTSGAYNFGTRFWSVRAGDFAAAEALMFADTDGGGGWTGLDILINATLDPRSGELATFSKGRGIGDCGSSGQWSWDGYKFKLREMRAMDKCEGVGADKWPVVFKAKKK